MHLRAHYMYIISYDGWNDIYIYSFIFNNSTGKQFFRDNKNCFPVELLKINEYEPRKSLTQLLLIN